MLALSRFSDEKIRKILRRLNGVVGMRNVLMSFAQDEFERILFGMPLNPIKRIFLGFHGRDELQTMAVGVHGDD